MEMYGGKSAKAPTWRIFMLQGRAIRYAAGLKQLESCRDSFRHLKILGYAQYTYKKLFYMQKKGVTAF